MDRPRHVRPLRARTLEAYGGTGTGTLEPWTLQEFVSSPCLPLPDQLADVAALHKQGVLSPEGFRASNYIELEGTHHLQSVLSLLEGASEP